VGGVATTVPGRRERPLAHVPHRIGPNFGPKRSATGWNKPPREGISSTGKPLKKGTSWHGKRRNSTRGGEFQDRYRNLRGHPARIDRAAGRSGAITFDPGGPGGGSGSEVSRLSAPFEHVQGGPTPARAQPPDLSSLLWQRLDKARLQEAAAVVAYPPRLGDPVVVECFDEVGVATHVILEGPGGRYPERFLHDVEAE
jgi:hypothetical protein